MLEAAMRAMKAVQECGGSPHGTSTVTESMPDPTGETSPSFQKTWCPGG